MKGKTVIRASRVSLMLAAVGVCALALGRPAAAQNLVTNGSFETGTNPGSFTTVGVGGTNITGWQVTSGTVDYIGTYWTAQDGARSIDLSGGGNGTLAQQSIATINGQVYFVSFWMAGNPDGIPLVKTLDATFGGTTQSFSFDVTGHDRNNMGWVNYSFYAAATGPSTTLSFLNTTTPASAFGPAIDNVSVSIVPEPEEYAVMGMVSLTICGLMLRARRRRAFGSRTA
jgi:choice-of-anchor C domain-containing protein